ncbi:MAG: hypothetical protein ACREQV_10405 [Candidatus Binatia bacterium]
MNAISKLPGIKGAVALAAILAMNGAALAKKPANSGTPAELSPDRTSATVTISVQCDPMTALNATGKLSVHVFQSVGRLINIGIGSGDVECTGLDTPQTVTVNAIPGLAFQPGPATLLLRFTTTDSITNLDTVQESGSRINLHP